MRKNSKSIFMTKVSQTHVETTYRHFCMSMLYIQTCIFYIGVKCFVIDVMKSTSCTKMGHLKGKKRQCDL